MSQWQPIEMPPDWKGPHSLRLLGILADGHHVFCQYTPFYRGHADEAKSLWVCEASPWAVKPTHWMPLPAPPSAVPPRPAGDDMSTAKLRLALDALLAKWKQRAEMEREAAGRNHEEFRLDLAHGQQAVAANIDYCVHELETLLAVSPAQEPDQ